jgi:geranylgeranyl pyrophosphate synthase
VVEDGAPAGWMRLIEDSLDALLPRSCDEPKSLSEAMRYAVLGGGKRIRAKMAMASALAAGGEPAQGLGPGCAAEFIHCFSLVHDDLPALDDDDLRRGKPTVHRKFGVATAILAGDALFALGFQALAQAGLPDGVLRDCLSRLTVAVGREGLVGGETLDLEATSEAASLPQVRQIHSMKTGALFSATCAMGGAAAGAPPAVVGALARFGADVGLAFQIADDWLDATADQDVVGKPVRTDAEHARATYPAVVGTEGAIAEARRLVAEATEGVKGLPGDSGPLVGLAGSCVWRGS